MSISLWRQSRMRIAGFALILLVMMRFGSAQRRNDEAMSAPNLALTMDASDSRVHGLPRAMTIQIKNISSHDLLIPEPHKDCGDEMYGSLFFRMNVRTTGGAPILGHGCAADYNFSRTSIEDRVRVWKRLAPGESLVYRKDAISETMAMLQGRLTSGVYTYSASYDPPYISDGDKHLLTAAGISFPHQRLATRPLVFTEHAAR